MIKPLTQEESKRAMEKAEANRYYEYGNYGENNGPLPYDEKPAKEME